MDIDHGCPKLATRRSVLLLTVAALLGGCATNNAVFEAPLGEPIEPLNETQAPHPPLPPSGQEGGEGFRDQRTPAAARALRRARDCPTRGCGIRAVLGCMLCASATAPSMSAAARLNDRQRVTLGQPPDCLGGAVTLAQFERGVEPFGALPACCRFGRSVLEAQALGLSRRCAGAGNRDCCASAPLNNRGLSGQKSCSVKPPRGGWDASIPDGAVFRSGDVSMGERIDPMVAAGDIAHHFRTRRAEPGVIFPYQHRSGILAGSLPGPSRCHNAVTA